MDSGVFLLQFSFMMPMPPTITATTSTISNGARTKKLSELCVNR